MKNLKMIFLLPMLAVMLVSCGQQTSTSNPTPAAPQKVSLYDRVMKAGKWVDLMRQHTPESEKLYTWWSYRAKDWALANRGRRLDHIWSTPGLSPACKDIVVMRETRGWTQTSDHVPVMATFDLDV